MTLSLLYAKSIPKEIAKVDSYHVEPDSIREATIQYIAKNILYNIYFGHTPPPFYKSKHQKIYNVKQQ